MFVPKKILYTTGVVAILVIGIGIGLMAQNDGVSLAPLYLDKVEQREQTAAVTNANRPDETNTTPSPVSPSQDGKRFRVVRVIDGDTIDVLIDGKVERVRYIGIDTPETVDPRKPVQCFGVEASKKNKELVEGKMVRLEKDITDRDKYNRLLRYVYLKPQMNADKETQIDAGGTSEILVNLALVEQGFAKSYSYPPDIKYQDRFVAAERRAREDTLGLWTACSKD